MGDAAQALWQILVPEALSRGVAFAAALAADLLQGLEVTKNGITRGQGKPGPPQGSGDCPKQAASLLGLGELLRCVPPSTRLLDRLWELDARLQGFAASVLSAWQAMSSAWLAWAGNGKGTNGAAPRGTLRGDLVLMPDLQGLPSYSGLPYLLHCVMSWIFGEF